MPTSNDLAFILTLIPDSFTQTLIDLDQYIKNTFQPQENRDVMVDDLDSIGEFMSLTALLIYIL